MHETVFDSKVGKSLLKPRVPKGAAGGTEEQPKKP